MEYTYVLLSGRDGRFYTGSTGDLRARFRDHAAGRVASTAYRRPLTLIYYEACRHPADAQRRERFLKTGKGKPSMPRKKPEALREMKTDELEQQLVVLTEERFRLGFRRATEALGNPLQLRAIRREIARINTILAERKQA